MPAELAAVWARPPRAAVREEKDVREYETTIIIQPEISGEGSATILEKMDGVLASSGATRLMCSDLGKRKLAYEIKKFQKGHYYILSFLDGGQVIPSLERNLGIEESVLRFMTVQVADEVSDIEARVEHSRELENEQKKRAAERAVREEEEAAARAEAEKVAAEEARARSEAEAIAKAESDAPDEAGSDASDEAGSDASDEAKVNAVDEAAPEASDSEGAGDEGSDAAVPETTDAAVPETTDAAVPETTGDDKNGEK